MVQETFIFLSGYLPHSPQKLSLYHLPPPFPLNSRFEVKKDDRSFREKFLLGKKDIKIIQITRKVRAHFFGKWRGSWFVSFSFTCMSGESYRTTEVCLGFTKRKSQISVPMATFSVMSFRKEGNCLGTGVCAWLIVPLRIRRLTCLPVFLKNCPLGYAPWANVSLIPHAVLCPPCQWIAIPPKAELDRWHLN